MNLGTAGWVLLLCSLLLPYITAWLSHHPSQFTGYATQALAAVGGIIADLSQHGWDNITWGAVKLAFLAWAVALGSHFGVTRQAEAKLYNLGPKLGKRSPGLPAPPAADGQLAA